MGDKSDGFSLDDLARQLAQSLPKNLRALGGDIERNFRALLQAGLEKMDLVTREEFDVQSAVLERTREKLEKIDTRLEELERGLASRKRTTQAAASGAAKPAQPVSGLESSVETHADASASSDAGSEPGV
ncbi:MAG TPA: accessory factor UbiK family protein [Gammaproteobacteria bacterium]|nr:accessory factor UbiK family protein [Gammaproteobacteria bacterium]